MNEYVDAVRVLSHMLDENRHLGDSLAGSTPLTQQICYGATRNWFYYDLVIDELLDKPLPEKHQDIWLLIMAGLYSIDHLHRPAHASVNHAVEAVNKFGKSWAKGLVNAILRRYGREKETLQPMILASEEARLNHPRWLIEAIRQDWPGHEEIFANNNQQAPLTLRVNLGRTERATYLDRLANDNIEARPGNFSPAAVILAKAVPIEQVPGFSEGLVSVQDETPQLAPWLMNLEPGLTVLDACAAPGGKTCHILEHEPAVKLTSLDRDRKRIHLIQENLDRLSLRAEVVAESLETFAPDHSFDRILVDAPCSATGIIRRHPDIKLLRTKSDVDKLSSIQRAFLDKAFDLLTIGGELLYSTCSILQQENDEVIADFVAAGSTRELITLATPESSTLPSMVSPSMESASVLRTSQGLQFLPTADDHDGFYYSAVRKVAE